MQHETGYEPESPQERAALRAIRYARHFVTEWREASVEIPELKLRQIAATLERLEDGVLFDFQDVSVLEILEKAIVRHVNDIREGYGSRAIRLDVSGDDILCPTLRGGRCLIEQWKCFKHARQHVLDLRQARKIADRFG